MVWYSFIFLAVLIQQMHCQFSPTLNVTCSTKPEYVFTITNQSTDGAVFIDGFCELQLTTASDGIYIFNTSFCSNPLPELGVPFTVRILEHAGFYMGDDKAFNVTCDPTLSLVEVEADFETSDQATVVLKGDADAPDLTVSTAVNGVGGFSGTVGDPAQINITMSTEDAALYGSMVLSVEYQATGVDMFMIENGCTKRNIFEQPALSSSGELMINFELFIAVNSSNNPPSIVTTTVTFEIEVKICPRSCDKANCAGRRRRSVENNNSTVQTIEYSTTFTVYPTGYKRPEQEETKESMSNRRVADNAVCLNRASFYGLICGLLLVLLVCVVISACMFFCLKKRLISKGSDTSYKNKAFN